jgi:hypothetical protein
MGASVKMRVVLAPAACAVGSVPLANILSSYARSIGSADGSKAADASADRDTDQQTSSSISKVAQTDANVAKAIARAKAKGSPSLPSLLKKSKPKQPRQSADQHVWFATSSSYGYVVIPLVVGMLASFALHAVWVTSENYSSPPLMVKARKGKGNAILMDDFRQGRVTSLSFAPLHSNYPTSTPPLSKYLTSTPSL